MSDTTEERSVPEGAATAAPADYAGQLRDANEKLYQHSLELSTRNKTLSLLRKLYQISILALETEPLAKKVVTIVRETFAFEVAGIYLVDDAGTQLLPLAFSRSERASKLAKKLKYPLGDTQIKNVQEIAFFKPLFANMASHSEHLSDAWGTLISSETLDKVAQEGNIHTISAYPLTIDAKLIGAFVLLLNRPYDSLTQFEKDSIASAMEVTAIALDRARLYEEIKRANEQQVLLIHFITHQIKGFVAKSRNIFSMILEGDFGKVPEEMKPMIEEGFKSDTKGAMTIQDILNAANMKSGKVTYANAAFDLKELTEEIIKDLKPIADTKGLALTFESASDSFMTNGDRSQMLNALKNLIDNSIKYTPSGSVAVSLSKQEGKIRFEIKDTGVGITTEDMAHLFTEGGHGKESQKINVDSTGFGLFIVKNIIEAHHGKVWAESEGAGKGSAFIVELPA